MAEEKTIIRSEQKPTIVLDDMIIDDVFEGTNDQLNNLKGSETGRQIQNELGTDYPFITINGYPFKVEEIVDFEISSTRFLPTIKLDVAMTGTSTFKSVAMPKDGDLVSVFIRAKNDAFKPIRNDYLITLVDVSPGAGEGSGSSIYIEGELFVPHLYDERIKSFDGTSQKVLKDVAKELGLGFATNETDTKDKQKWICAGSNYLDFILDITERSWKDEKSFYKVYIDFYYHLNFINVNNQLDSDDKMTAALLDTTLLVARKSGEKNVEKSQIEAKKLLSDAEIFSGTNMFIMQYGVKNNSSSISKDWGYKSHAQFYDQKSQKTWDIFVDPLISSGAENKKILLKGRAVPKASNGEAEEKYWETQIKKYWLGIQYKDVHDKYLYSKLWNERNNVELEKMYLEAITERWNPNMYRGEKIPILLISGTDMLERSINAAPDEDTYPGASVALQLYSGFYMINGIKILYKMMSHQTDTQNPKPPAPGLSAKFLLTRREWPVPATG